MVAYRNKLINDVTFYQFLQYEFYSQWKDLKKYANEKGIKIIGDIPIYVALDSADTWAHPELFKLDAENALDLFAADDYAAKAWEIGIAKPEHRPRHRPMTRKLTEPVAPTAASFSAPR